MLTNAGVREVYGRCMTRTNIDIDDDLVHEVMRRYGVTTKKDAVDLALRKAVPPPVTKEFLLSFAGIGWSGLSIEEIRGYDSATEDRAPGGQGEA